MDNPTVSGLRSRSRSKTPIKRSTPIKEFRQTTKITEIISESPDEFSSPPAYRTRQSIRNADVQTSDYSSEDAMDRLKHRKEIFENEINNQYERRVSTSSQHGYSVLDDVTLSPIQTSFNLIQDRSKRYGSPSTSICSTDSSFAEQALANTNALLIANPNNDHLPSRLYKMAGEYWNKYPKTDYTYSPLSKDRVELAPGQIAMPNMSRRSLSQFRVQGPNVSDDEVDRLAATSAWTTNTLRKRYISLDSSDDEDGYYKREYPEERWWITQMLVSLMTTVTTAASNAYRKVVEPSHRYPYTDRRPKVSIASRAAAVVTAPFYWIYTLIEKVVTTTITTVTETITPNHVAQTGTYLARPAVPAKRRWWPWLLLLLLPAVGYGCYNNEYIELPHILTSQEKPAYVDTYKSPQIVQDPDLSKRMAALEDWAVNVDSRLKFFDQKLSKIDNLEAQIEQYSFKYLQQNLIQVFNTENTEVLAEKLKGYFDKYYMTSEQLQALSQEVHERLISTWKPDMDEDFIRRLIQEYMSVFEKKQMQVLSERLKLYLREVEVHHTGGGMDIEAVRRVVAGMLNVYDADKTGLVDYALESAGGQVISTKCTELYQIKTKQYSILGLPVWWVYTSPRYALTPGAMPAECWAFQGFPGYLVVRTYAIIEVTGFSLEHMSRLLAVEGKIESAPKNFSVYGLHGEQDPDPHLFGDYMYEANGTAIQYFPVKYPKTTLIGGVPYPVAYDIIELRVESNHGNPTYTCVYRFRVHGNPLSDIRQATEDSILDSEL